MAEPRRKTHVLLCKWLLPHHFVFMMGSMLLLSFVCGYAISVGFEKVNPLFPYISDTGTRPPASCVFGLLLNLAAVFTVVVIYIRHGYFEKICPLEESHRAVTVNDVSFFTGLISALGISIVACFQETNVLTVHLIGAMMAFVAGICYCWQQSYLSLKLLGLGLTSKVAVRVRFFLSGCTTVCLLLVIAGAKVASMKAVKAGKSEFKLDWKKGEPGYAAHLVSTFSEWTMAVCFVMFFMTFHHEFKNVESNVHIKKKNEAFDGRSASVAYA